jgi:hypothetical protein
MLRRPARKGLVVEEVKRRIRNAKASGADYRDWR